MKDLCFFDQDQVFSCRAAGILMEDHRILIQDNGDGKRFMFPGGHVRYQEESSRALVREFQEEGDIVVQIDRFLGWKEFFFEWNDLHIHQLCAFYLLKPQGGPICDHHSTEVIRDEVSQYRHDSKMTWIDKDLLLSHTVYPTNILMELNQSLGGSLLK